MVRRNLGLPHRLISKNFNCVIWVKEKLSDEEKQKYNAIFLEISKQIPNETYIELSKITDEINRDKFALTVPYRFEIFQDLFDENQRKRIDIINFLLWNVE